MSTPSGIVTIRSGSTPKSLAMSSAELDDTVMISCSLRETRFCIPRKPNQRHVVIFLWSGASFMASARSRVIGWWTVATTGKPAFSRSSSPLPRHWLSCTTSKSARRDSSVRAARILNVRGSGNPAVHMVTTSSMSIPSRISRGCGVRNGSASL